MKRRVNVRGLVVDDEGHVFAVKHRDRHTGGESEFWATPGGGLDQNESLHDGLVREFVEEIGIIPQIGRLLFVQQFIAQHRDGSKTEKLEFFFHITNTVDFQKDIDLSAASHGDELVRIDFIDTKKNDILPAFMQDIDIKQHIDTNQPVAVFDNIAEPPRL